MDPLILIWVNCKFAKKHSYMGVPYIVELNIRDNIYVGMPIHICILFIYLYIYLFLCDGIKEIDRATSNTSFIQ